MSEPVFPPLVQAAVSIHEQFLSYVNAGFTREEALRITIATLQTFMQMTGPVPPGADA